MATKMTFDAPCSANHPYLDGNCDQRLVARIEGETTSIEIAGRILTLSAEDARQLGAFLALGDITGFRPETR